MMSLSIRELETYENELYQLWTQASVIRRYRYELESQRVLLNDTSVIDMPLLTSDIITLCEECECEPCACTQIYGEEE